MEYTNKEWVWQFDPLSPDKMVEIVQNSQAIFLTKTLENAQRLCQILNSYQEMYEALKVLIDYLEDLTTGGSNRQWRTSYADKLVSNCQKALAKADGK